MATIEMPDRDVKSSEGVTLVEVVLNHIEDVDKDRPIWQLLKANPRIIGYAICANFGPLLFGYDGLALSTIIALPAFSFTYGETFGDRLIIPALWQGLWTAFNQFGIMLGAIGRKAMFHVGNAIATASIALAYTSPLPATVEARRALLLVAKIINGCGMGILMSTCQTYVSEISPTRLRATLLGFYTFVLTIGQTIAISVVFSRVEIMTNEAYLVPIALQFLFAGLVLIGGILVPESPAYLLTKGKTEQARRAFGRLYGKNSTERIERELASLTGTIEHEQSERRQGEGVHHKEMFKGSNARRTRIVWLLNTLQQFTGVSLLVNSTYFLIMAGMNPSQSLAINQIGISLGMPCILISYYTMQKFGRRNLILAGMGVTVVIFLCMGIAALFPGNAQALRFIGVAILLVGFVGNLGVLPAYQVAASEVSSVSLRAKTLSSGFVVNALVSWLFAFTVPYMFNADAGNLGGKIGFVFVGLGIIGFVLVWLYIPETKNKTYAQLDFLFDQGYPTRKFKEDITVGAHLNATVKV